VRRTKLSDPPEVLIAARRHYAATQDAVEIATSDLQAVRR